jgi:phage terminase small subunit
MPKGLKLTRRQTSFIEHLATLGDNDATKAAKLAGYSEKSANRTAYRLLRKPLVKAELERIRGLAANKIVLAAADIMAGLLAEAQTATLPADRIRAWAALQRMVPGAIVPQQLRGSVLGLADRKEEKVH